MDPKRFDRLTLFIGSGSSRRQVLKALAGGVLGSVAAGVGLGGASAASWLRSVGNSCNRNSDCASGLCVQESRTRKICHCVSAADCPAGKDACHSPICLATGYCGVSINAGTACDDGNACTTNDLCQADGSCVGTPVVCTALDACHVAGTCDPATGTCSNPPAPDGTVCSPTAQCVAGACVDLCSGACMGGCECYVTVARQAVCTFGYGVLELPDINCAQDSDCPSGQGYVCAHIGGRNYCVQPETVCAESPCVGTSCTQGSDCPTGSSCYCGVCGPIADGYPCGSGLPCESFSNCVNGVCTPA